MTLKSLLKYAVLAAVLVVAWSTGAADKLLGIITHRQEKTETAAVVAPPSVTISRVAPAEFVETVLVTGSLTAREEILIAPEVDGLRVVEIKVEQGDTVKKGDVLAVLETETLDAQLAQNTAAQDRATAAVAQAKSQITEVEARLTEAKAALDRAKPLTKSGYLSESVLDQRQALSRSLTALLQAARDGLKAAEADKVQVEAQRRELDWRRSRTLVRAPVDGLVSRRTARIGAIATGASASAGEPMFRLIQNGEIELDAEVSESDLRKIVIGQSASIVAAGGTAATGKVRLVAPEVDSATRLGRVRIFIGADPRLRIGSFASGTIETARERGLGVPVSAVSTMGGLSTTLVVDGEKVSTRTIETGLSSGGLIEVVKGLTDGEKVVARAGTFLKDGDIVRPVESPAGTVSEAR